MATEVVMPKLGLTMERGTIGAWLKAEGEAVAPGEPLLEVVTDKVTMEVEAQSGGVLRRIFVEEGVEVEVATPIGVIGSTDEDISHFGPAATPSVGAPTPIPVQVPVAETSAMPQPASIDGQRPHRTSPKARRIAAEHGIDLAGLRGSGPSGRVVSADVEASLAAGSSIRPRETKSQPELTAQVVELTRPQQVAAERLTASHQQAPHIYLEATVSAVWLKQLRDGYAVEAKEISYNDLILKAVATALRDHPRLNSHFIDGRVHQQGSIDIGMAVDTPQGLMVPVVRDLMARSIEDIGAESQRLVDAARHGQLSIDDLVVGGFTVSNLGMYGITRFTAIINPPQVAILAVGAIESTVVAVGTDGIALRPSLRLTLSADHRAIDGAMSARFLQRLKDILENPGLLA